MEAREDDAMMAPQFDDADLAEWLAGLPSPLRSPEKIVHHQMEDEIELILLGPHDEKHLPSTLGLLHHHGHKLKDYSDSVTGDEATTAKRHSEHQTKGYIVGPSLLDLLPMTGSWGGHGQRICRRGSKTWRAEISHIFGLQKTSASRTTKIGSMKKNYKFWTPLEAKKLVKGLTEYGVGKWGMVKKTYFKSSPRKASQLKDKWRDLLRDCGIQVSYNKKVQAPNSTSLLIVEGLKDEIINVHNNHVPRKRRACR